MHSNGANGGPRCESSKELFASLFVTVGGKTPEGKAALWQCEGMRQQHRQPAVECNTVEAATSQIIAIGNINYFLFCSD